MAPDVKVKQERFPWPYGKPLRLLFLSIRPVVQAAAASVCLASAGSTVVRPADPIAITFVRCRLKLIHRWTRIDGWSDVSRGSRIIRRFLLLTLRLNLVLRLLVLGLLLLLLILLWLRLRTAFDQARSACVLNRLIELRNGYIFHEFH